MAGVDRRTGKPLEGWAHTAQSLRVIFRTMVGSRVMRRRFGSAVPQVLGRNITPGAILRFKAAVIVAVELWEPRFRITWVRSDDDNTPEGLRQGRVNLSVEGTYMPRGHLGDNTPEIKARTLAL